MGGDKILVLTPSERPIVLKLTEALRAEVGTLRFRLASAAVDVRVLGERQTEQELVRQLVPTMGQYRAVFATTMTLARAMQKEDGATPIVFDGGANPLSMCLVDSLQKPGRNATGYIHYLPGDDAKMIELLVDGFPALRKVYYAVAGDNVFPASCDPLASEDATDALPCVAGPRRPDRYLRRRADADGILEFGAKHGLDVKFVVLCRRSDFHILATLESDRTDVGLVVPWQYLFSVHAQELVDRVGQARHPAMYGLQKFARLGGVMAIEPTRDASDDRIPIDMLLQVLDGRAPATLPIQVPRGFRLTVNAAAAAAQGLRPALKLLRRADEVIVGTER